MNLPILNNVLLQADAGGLKLISTNLEIAITCHIRGKVEQQGEYTVPSKLFFDYVNLMPNERVDMDLLDDALQVTCARSKTKMKGIIASEFPLVPPVTGGVNYAVSVSEFQQALSQVLFAAATNESQLRLTGILLSFHNPSSGTGTLTLAATDSYRLAEAVVKVSSGSDMQKDVIVPQRTLAELSRVFSVFKDDVEAPVAVDINISDNQIVFRYGSVEITSRTIEAEYPDYRQIIPATSESEAIFERTTFVQAVKTASLFSKTGLFDVQIVFDPDMGVLTLTGVDAGRGENTVQVEANISGKKNMVTLNYRYLLDGLNAMKSDTIELKIIDGANPCLLLPHAGMPDDRYRYIIMPIRQ